MVKHMLDVENSEEELVQVFKCFDKDRDGFVGSEDLLQMMVELGNDMTIEEAKNMIFLFDEKGDGMFDFRSFVELMMFDTLDQNLFEQIGEKPERDYNTTESRADKISSAAK